MSGNAPRRSRTARPGLRSGLARRALSSGWPREDLRWVQAQRPERVFQVSAHVPNAPSGRGGRRIPAETTLPGPGGRASCRRLVRLRGLARHTRRVHGTIGKPSVDPRFNVLKGTLRTLEGTPRGCNQCWLSLSVLRCPLPAGRTWLGAFRCAGASSRFVRVPFLAVSLVSGLAVGLGWLRGNVHPIATSLIVLPGAVPPRTDSRATCSLA
jgi:hypothetical protein